MTLEERAFRKATRRLIPFLFLIYVVAYLDRVNVSFAQLQLEDDLDFSDTIFGIGAGIFSLGYVIFGVPSNLALARFGARRWLAAIMVAWGVISASMMFIGGPAGYYVLRFLLGAAEAGFFPGIILFLTWWFPERQRTPALALFFTAVSVAYVFGGPISGGLLELDSFAGLDGWQWLFLIEGLPAIALGFVTLRYLDERPEDAAWLDPEEREFLEAEVRREHELRERLGPERVRDALKSRSVWGYGLVNFVLLAAGFGLTFFVPAPRAGPDRLHGLRGGRARGDPVRVRHRGDDRGGAAPGRRWRRCMITGAVGTVHHGLRAVAVAAHGRHHTRGGGPARGAAAVLDRSHDDPERHRRGRGDRADRRPRQPRRLRRAGLHRDREGPNGRLRDAARHARGDPRRLRPRHRAWVSATTRSASATSPAMITTRGWSRAPRAASAAPADPAACRAAHRPPRASPTEAASVLVMN